MTLPVRPKVAESEIQAKHEQAVKSDTVDLGHSASGIAKTLKTPQGGGRFQPGKVLREVLGRAAPVDEKGYVEERAPSQGGYGYTPAVPHE